MERPPPVQRARAQQQVRGARGGEGGVGLRADGSIEAWGHNGAGQCDVPAPNTGFMAIAAAFGQSMSLRAYSCPADFNDDGIVNTLDFIAYLNAYNIGDLSADMNGDGIVNTLDFIAFLNAYNEGC